MQPGLSGCMSNIFFQNPLSHSKPNTSSKLKCERNLSQVKEERHTGVLVPPKERWKLILSAMLLIFCAFEGTLSESWDQIDAISLITRLLIELLTKQYLAWTGTLEGLRLNLTIGLVKL